MATRIGDRVYRSEATFLGVPLIDINLSAPLPPGRGKPTGLSVPDGERRVDGRERKAQAIAMRHRHLAALRRRDDRLRSMDIHCSASAQRPDTINDKTTIQPARRIGRSLSL